jgi:tetratricopeptide (TPR) repeat protein
MGFRARKSIKLAPGVRLNVSKTGVGLGIGPRGARYTIHSSGRRTYTARSGIPGIYYQSQSSARRRRTSSAAAPAAPQRPPKPGLFAPKGEKALYNAIHNDASPEVIARIGDEHPDYRVIAYSIAGVEIPEGADAREEVVRLLGTAFASGEDPAASPFARKYLFTKLELDIATGVTVHLPLNRDAVGLALGEAYQAAGETDKAIETVEQLEPTTYAAVSLAELYTQAERYNDVIGLTEGISNEDDSTMLLLIFRGIAFREKGFYDAAHETFKEALRSRSRAAETRHLALFERSRNYLAQGKNGLARKDLERILAEDSSYEGVREQLAALGGSAQRGGRR